MRGGELGVGQSGRATARQRGGRVLPGTWCCNDPNWDYKTLSFETAAEQGDKAAGHLHQRHRNQPEAVLRSWRQAPDVARVERPVRFTDQLDQLLQRDPQQPGDQGEDRTIRSGCSWCRGWTTAAAAKARTSSTQMGVLDRWVEQKQTPTQIRRVAPDRRQGRSHAAPMRLSTGGALQRQRQHRRRREFLLPGEVTEAGTLA